MLDSKPRHDLSEADRLRPGRIRAPVPLRRTVPSTPFIDGEQDTGHDQRQHRRRTVDVGYTDAIAADLCEYSPAGTWPR